jgi:hypothetical protein
MHAFHWELSDNRHSTTTNKVLKGNVTLVYDGDNCALHRTSSVNLKHTYGTVRDLRCLVLQLNPFVMQNERITIDIRTVIIVIITAIIIIIRAGIVQSI